MHMGPEHVYHEICTCKFGSFSKTCEQSGQIYHNTNMEVGFDLYVFMSEKLS